MISIDDLGTVLGVWAHPDDEAYLSGGLMALARERGNHVVVVTATAGEQGSADPERRGSPAFAQLRREELAASLGYLDVTDHHVLGLADGGCDALPPDEGSAMIDRWIADVAPDTIVTFGPEGMTGHPDHRAVHRWTVDAWERSGRRARLLLATVTPEFHDEWGPVNEQLGIWEGEAPCTARHDLALQIDCTPVLDQKDAALQAHASQIGPIVAMIGASAFRRWWATESFVAPA